METNNEKSLDMLRVLYKEGRELKGRLLDNPSRDEWHFLYNEIIGWSFRVRNILKNIFYSSKYVDEYAELLQQSYDERGDDLDAEKVLFATIDYIKTIGQLLKFQYVKDPYTGISNDESKICFVAMWFDPSMDDIYANGILAPITELGYDVVRIDKEEHNERIDQRIFELIRKARFMVADFTENRAGVYYEAGFANGQGIPVIHTCHARDFDKRHFDIGTLNTIKYTSAIELAPMLSKRVEETIGRYTLPRKIEKVSESDEFPF